MPPVNIYFRRPGLEPQIVDAAEPLRDHVASQLSTEERVLTREEISVRIFKSLGDSMLADLEMDILAASNTERADYQDEICDSVREFMLAQIPELNDAKVWLALPTDLGYSFGRPTNS